MRNQQIITSFNNVDGSHKHNVEPTKPDTIENILYDSTILNSKPGKTNLQF